MIVLFTDFGADDIYVGQVKAALLEHLPAEVAIIDLLHSAPNFDARASAHLLAALQRRFPAGAVFLTVVDPGVGTDRHAVVVQADGKWYVGPDNGLLSVVAERSVQRQTWRIVWRPPMLSMSFHGRDLFAPFAAWLARGDLPADKIEETDRLQVRFGTADLPQVVYIDHYGNALTGLRASTVPQSAVIAVREHRIRHARTFADAPARSAFWYENSIGLVELAVNGASVAALLGVEVGTAVGVAG